MIYIIPYPLLPAQQIELVETPVLGEAFANPSALFTFSYPFHDTSAKTQFEQKIYDHYKYRRLCDDKEKFSFFLQRKLNEILPFYNQLYASTKLSYEPLFNFNVTESLDENNSRNTTGNGGRSSKTLYNEDGNTTDTGENQLSNAVSNFSNVTATNDATKFNKKLDTPQGVIENLDKYMTVGEKDATTQKNISEQNDIATETSNGSLNHGQVNSKESESTFIDDYDTTNTENGTRKYTLSKKGLVSGKSVSELLLEYRKTMLNIDMLIIDDLAECFYNLVM